MSRNVNKENKSSRVMPLRMAEKLKQIRASLDLSQKEISIRLGEYTNVQISRSSISDYERGKREPPIVVILAYSKLANVFMDALADDALDLSGTTVE